MYLNKIKLSKLDKESRLLPVSQEEIDSVASKYLEYIKKELRFKNKSKNKEIVGYFEYKNFKNVNISICLVFAWEFKLEEKYSGNYITQAFHIAKYPRRIILNFNSAISKDSYLRNWDDVERETKNVLSHEMTHAKELFISPTGNLERKEYINHPAEVRAYARAIIDWMKRDFEDMKDIIGTSDIRKILKELLDLNVWWKTIEEELNPESKKRILLYLYDFLKNDLLKEKTSSMKLSRLDKFSNWESFQERFNSEGEKIIGQFLSGRRKIFNWDKVKAQQLKKVWMEFAKYGFVRNESELNEIAESVLNNIARLQFTTEVMGHKSVDPKEVVESIGYDFSDEQIEKLGDFLTDKKGNYMLSDYGLPQLIDLYNKIEDETNAEQKLVAIDMALQITHQRSDLAEFFVEGGTTTLAILHNYVESLKEDKEENKEKVMAKMKLSRLNKTALPQDYSAWMNLDGRFISFLGWGKHRDHYKDLGLSVDLNQDFSKQKANYVDDIALSEGWRGIYFNGKELVIGDRDDIEIPRFLKIIQKNRPEWMYPEIVLFNHADAVRLDEGEDALDAWNNRFSIRKKVAVLNKNSVASYLKFWMTPEGEIYWKGSGDHKEHLPEKYMYEGNRNISPSGKAISDGWIRGYNNQNTLGLSLNSYDRVEWALSKLPQEMKFVKMLIVELEDNLESTYIKIEEDEDALDAWRNRNSIRKRVAKISLSTRDEKTIGGVPDSEVRKNIFDQQSRWKELEEKLFEIGGNRIIFTYEEDLDKILSRAQYFNGRGSKLMIGEPSHCHGNAACLWNNNRDRAKIMTGWALSDDNIWRQHSWLYNIFSKKIIETTKRRKAYFGFMLNKAESEEFYDNNW